MQFTMWKGAHMTQEEKLVYLRSQIVCMEAEIKGMEVENLERERNGYAPAYDGKAFYELSSKYGLNHNQVIGYLTDRR
jgi:hypothetical protein